MSSLPSIDDFEVLERLGAGSYSTVYKTRHKKNRTYHAIKFVEISPLSHSARENLIQEIGLLRSLNHKYIVTLEDFFWDDKTIYIVLEYCNAGNLSTFIRSKKALPEDTCKYFLRQLASAVQYMRSNDISHFDLKPQNLLLTRTPHSVFLKVGDFGFAQHLKLGETNKQLKGSPLYMAPEIVCKQQYDAKADLWSIGIILYECLFGRAPYSSKTFDELIGRIRSAEKIVIPPNAHISSTCSDFLCRLLQHDPSQRISFDAFFAHPFLDLRTLPTDRTLEKAIDIVTQAVNFDESQNYRDAYHTYCTALQYFAPLILEETDSTKRTVLRSRALTYLKRAEEIKNSLLDKEQDIRTNQTDLREEQPSTSRAKNSVIKALEPDERFRQLYAMSHSSPQLKTALEIGRKGELYLYERKFEAALDSFTSALGILMPFINNEPKGDRRNLIKQQLEYWMKEAESIKSIIAVRELDTNQRMSSVRNCSIQ